MPEDYHDREVERLTRDIERLHEMLRNPQPPMVPLSLFEEVRKTTGERLGVIEATQRQANARIMSSFLFPVAVVIVAALVTQALN